MTLLHPIWLLLTIPLGVMLWVWPMPSRLLVVLRVLIFALVLIAMSGLAVRLPSRAGTVVVIADRSLSMPDNSAAYQTQIINALYESMGRDDQLAVVSFGQQVAVEQPPQKKNFSGFVNLVGPEASNLGEALEKSISLISQESPGRILILSDGRWTGADPVGVTALASTRRISIDYRLLQRPTTNDTAISNIQGPKSVNPGESFMLTAWIHCPVSQEITYKLIRNGVVISSGKNNAHSGLNRLIFRDQAKQPGVHQYRLTVNGSSNDPIPENNTARMLIGIDGQRPILLVTQSPKSNFGTLLQNGKLDIKTVRPENAGWALEDISGYSTVLIENTPAEKIGAPGMANLAAWVSQSAGGLMMTGGKASYGPGGYFKSPLDPIMPVSMELRREHRKFSVAIVVALDRSGSMSIAVPTGQRKMDLANIASAEVLDLLSPMDEFGVLAVDSQAHLISPLRLIEDKKADIRNRILSINSQGGGIFVYEALSNAVKMLTTAQAKTRHVILFADAADSEQPGKYKELLDQCSKSEITVSVIGLGKPTDVDAAFLQDVAKRGKGRIYFTENAQELPRLFTQDTFVVARSSFLDQQTPVKFTAGLFSMTGKVFTTNKPVGGYNLTYLKKGATLAVLTSDEYKAPIVAGWQAGLGRVMCYTGEADGKYTGNISKWSDIGVFYSSLARWTTGGKDNLPGGMFLMQEIKSGTSVITLHLDPKREAESFHGLPEVTTLTGTLGEKPTSIKHKMQWASADALSVEVSLSGNQTSISTIEIDNIAKVSLPPICLPYSPEYKPVDNDLGPITLDKLARATGGKQRDILSETWKDLPKYPRLFELYPWIVFVVIGLFILEILERRSGLLSMSTKGKLFYETKDDEKRKTEQLRSRPSKTLKLQPLSPASEKNIRVDHPDKSESLEHAPEADIFDAIRKAQRKAKDRMDRKN